MLSSARILIIFIAYFLFFSINSFSQTIWTARNPFEQKVFVENKGQCDQKTNNDNGKILFSTSQQGIKIYWSNKGITYKTTEHYREAEQKKFKKEEQREEEEKKVKTKFHFLQMEWIGANPNAEVISEEPVSYYFTYSDPNDNRSGIKTPAFKKIIYKNIYPNIDVEYILPEKGGIKYSFIVHPGADISSIKIKYKADKINLNSKDEIEINTKDCGNYREYGLKSYYDGGDPAASTFSLKNGVIGFNIPDYDKSRKLIIDPSVIWTSVPVFNNGGNFAFDVDWDNAGNCYAHGGFSEVLKYNSSGTLLWHYDPTVSGYGNWTGYGDFAVDKTSGSVYIGEGQQNSSGSRIIKLNSAGSQTAAFAGDPNFTEIWRMAFSPCSGVIAAGGGITTPLSYHACLLDTNLANPMPVDMLNPPPTISFDHDPWGLALDADQKKW